MKDEVVDDNGNKSLYLRKIEDEEFSEEVADLIEEALDSLEMSLGVSLGVSADKIKDIH